MNMKPGRRAALVRLAGTLLPLAVCSPLLAAPPVIEIPQERLFAQVSAQFPVSARLLEVFDVTLAAPKFRLLPQENRIATELDVTAIQGMLGQQFNGRLGLTYGLRFEPADATVRLAGVRIARFQMDGVPDTLQTPMGRLGAQLAEQVLEGFAVHRFKPEDLQFAHDLGLQPGAIKVTERGLAVTLEPRARL
jgi:hypothetical protein